MTSATMPAAGGRSRTNRETWRTTLLAAAAVRIVLGIVAIPLAPVLYRHHFVVLVLLRPTKDVLLASGFFVRRGSVNLPEVLAAAIPLAIGGVWLFYALGRAYREEIASGEGLPRWARRILDKDKIERLSRLLDRRGSRLIVLGRLAAFPSTALAAAAGASEMEPRSFLVADAVGGLLSIAEVLIAGFAFGAAYKRAGPWLTGAGVAVLLALLFLAGRWLRRDAGD